ncbi:hypothetical protein AB2C90_32360, partial [Pseudomonas aeruginosa]
GNKISNPPWVKFQSAGWVNFPSAPTSKRCRWLHYAIMPFLCQALKGREDYSEEHPQRTELPLAAAQLRLLDHLIAFD